MMSAAILVAVLATPACAGGTMQDSERAQRPGGSGPVARFGFDGNVDNAAGTTVDGVIGGTLSFVEGLDGQALSLTSVDSPAPLALDNENLPFDRSEDFSVQSWVRTTAGSDRRMVVLSQKEFADNSLASQKQSGWVFYISDGTWAWNMGSGARRITYERDNGEHMPLNDGRWHQLTMTYDSARAEVRLFYDGQNKVVYNVDDSAGFDFTNSSPLVVGWTGTEVSPQAEIAAAVYAGAEDLQELVDGFNSLGVKEVEADEFVNLIVEPGRLFDEKVAEMTESLGAEGAAFRESMQSVDFEQVSAVEAALMRNPYTIHQAFSFMEAAPLLKIFSLVDGEVTIREDAAKAFTERERLYPPEFDIDNLGVWDRVLPSEEVLDSYSEYFKLVVAELEEKLTSITASAWNIFHGGKHFTIEEHGWDSRVAIAEIVKRENVDIVMMQETYSSGDFIAAELGYYFATTVDRDYLNQGANISVISRYPIKELHVQADSPFMNVGAKIAVSATQDLWAMANWYGMQQFPAVVEFHQTRFQESDTIPTLFAGDFNAVPHTDGGDSPASRALLDAGFTDAFRSSHPEVQESPGFTHRSGRRIDQLYYKGVGLRNTSTRLVSTWPTGFPSDHFLLLSTFDLIYSSTDRE
jgi:exonuclease III